MSAFTCDHGESYPLFGQGGGEALAAEADIPFIGGIPLEPAVSQGGDTGSPIALRDGAAAEAFGAIVDRLVNELAPPVAMAGCSARMLNAAMAALDALDA
jgi:ATP-binding protein involved in chromosome partitioning